MKGVVFTEFIEFIEEKFGFDISDDMIEGSELSTKGIFTQAGNYPFGDMANMVQTLSKITNIEASKLIEAYGEHLFSRLVQIYPKPIQTYTNTFDFIQNVENVVHPEVKKLYPDSDLPTFEEVSRSDTELKVNYISSKPLMDFAKGLMLGCANYYKEDIEVSYELKSTDDVFKAEFTIIKK